MQSEKESGLVSVPSKTIYQGEIGVDEEFEKPIIVNYYENCVELDQQSNSKILINNEHFEHFIRCLRKDFKNAALLRK